MSLDWVRGDRSRNFIGNFGNEPVRGPPIHRNDKCISIIAARCGIGRGELPRVSRLDESAGAN